MLPVLFDDVAAAARALLAAPERRRDFVLARILAEARAAYAARCGTGRFHPIWGDGSLMAAALRRPVAGGALSDPAFRREVIRILRALGADQPRAQERQRATAGSRSRRPGAISSPQSVQ